MESITVEKALETQPETSWNQLYYGDDTMDGRPLEESNDTAAGSSSKGIESGADAKSSEDSPGGGRRWCSSETSNDSSGTGSTSRRRRSRLAPVYAPGTRIEARDFQQQQWYPAKVVSLDEAEEEVLIHFEGWSSRYDEWLPLGSPRLRLATHPHTRKEHLKKQAPRKPEYKKGEEVLARWGDRKTYPAKVLEVNEEGTYCVLFFDGIVKTLKAINVEKMPQEQKGTVVFPKVPHPEGRRSRDSSRKQEKESPEAKRSERPKGSRSEGRKTERRDASASPAPSSSGSSSRKRILLIGGKFMAKKARPPDAGSRHDKKSKRKASFGAEDSPAKTERKMSATVKDAAESVSPALLVPPLAAPQHDASLSCVARKEFVIEEDHNHFKCSFVGCTKSFRKEPLLLSHLKHYHSQRPSCLPEVEGEAWPSEEPPSEPPSLVPPSENPLLQAALQVDAGPIGSSVGLSEVSPVERPDVPAPLNIGGGQTSHEPLPSDPISDLLGTTAAVLAGVPSTGGVPKPRRMRFIPHFETLVEGREKRKIAKTEKAMIADMEAAASRRGSGSSSDRKRKRTSSMRSDKSDEGARRGARVSETGGMGLDAGMEDLDGFPVSSRSKKKRHSMTTPFDPSLFLDASDGLTTGEGDVSVDVRSDEVVQCACNCVEESGLMIQCEACLTWQHGSCFGIEEEKSVPDKYICYICLNPKGMGLDAGMEDLDGFPVSSRSKKKRHSMTTPFDPSLFLDASDGLTTGEGDVSVDVRSDEVVQCACNCVEESGLMIQCEACLTWQHGSCFGIEEEKSVPDKYICYICLNPKANADSGAKAGCNQELCSGMRNSFRYKHDQDWLVRGKMASFGFLRERPSNQPNPEPVRATHDLMCSMHNVHAVLQSMTYKLNVAGSEDHPDLKHFAKPWLPVHDVVPTRCGAGESMGSTYDHAYFAAEQEPPDDPVQGAPDVIVSAGTDAGDLLMQDMALGALDVGCIEEVVNKGEELSVVEAGEEASVETCKRNLLSHIFSMQDQLEHRLSCMEDQLHVLEQEGSVNAPDSMITEEEDMLRLKLSLKGLMKDLSAVHKLALFQ